MSPVIKYAGLAVLALALYVPNVGTLNGATLLGLALGASSLLKLMSCISPDSRESAAIAPNERGHEECLSTESLSVMGQS